jgi:hypothetical protein
MTLLRTDAELADIREVMPTIADNPQMGHALVKATVAMMLLNSSRRGPPRRWRSPPGS